MRPLVVPTRIKNLLRYSEDEKAYIVRQQYKSLLKGVPEVTVVIPAYNEEATILNALVSVTANITHFSVEVIVVNNNSTDRTEELVRSTGVRCINETTKGVKAARTAGLMAAAGKYILNADADSIYAPAWVETMITPLENNTDIALTYGTFAFLPGPHDSRFPYFVYESMADVLRMFKRWFREEAVNVYGCSSGFRRSQCLQVDGYEHPPGANEDGYLALKLRDKGLGKLKRMPGSNIIVWTIDRHLQQDGGLMKSFFIRVKGAIFGHDPKHYHQK